MSTFEYPCLPRKEIVDILVETGIINITEANFINPQPEIVCHIYASLLNHLDSLQEDLGQLGFEALENLDNPDAIINSIWTMNLYSKLKQMVAAVGCPRNFTLKDLIKPDSTRTEFFVSAILNFILHRDSKMNLLKPIVEKLSLLDEKKKGIEEKILQLNAEIAEHNEAREREQPLVQEVEAKVKDLRQTIQVLNNQQMSLKATFRTKREKAKETDDKISEAEYKLVQSVQENESLRSKIVQSPDKLQRALEEKASVRDQAKSSERSAMQLFQEKTATMEIYTKACNKMSKHFNLMQAIQEQVNNAKTVEKDVKVLKAKLSDEGLLDKSLEVKLVERQGKAEQLDESKRQLEREKEIKYEEARKELNNMELEMKARKCDLEARHRKVEATIAEVDSITSQINSVRESGAAKQLMLAQKCEEIVREEL
ncbi:Kinetochore protein Nuf2, N-terminal [Dillenia turbinata]|uniref:Kinetochore protein Nuf2, N-terminal n=1 Tax=Dillenia turbinata TaxID=194707 RepID=A0AAN8ZST8_9MAGN